MQQTTSQTNSAQDAGQTEKDYTAFIAAGGRGTLAAFKANALNPMYGNMYRLDGIEYSRASDDEMHVFASEFNDTAATPLLERYICGHWCPWSADGDCWIIPSPATSQMIDVIGVESSYNGGDEIVTKDGREWIHSGKNEWISRSLPLRFRVKCDGERFDYHVLLCGNKVIAHGENRYRDFKAMADAHNATL